MYYSAATISQKDVKELEQSTTNILQKALAGYEPDFKSDEGLVQWGLVQKAIHDEFDSFWKTSKTRQENRREMWRKATEKDVEFIMTFADIDISDAKINVFFPGGDSLASLDVNEYQVEGGGPDDLENVRLERRWQIEGPDKWAIIGYDLCFGKDGRWYREPIPSNRDDEFMELCRFDSAREALEFWEGRGLI